MARLRDPLFAAKVAVARGVGTASRRSGRGGGSTVPGRVLARLAPDALERLSGELADGAILVSATNGKTTTCAMIAHVLAPDHRLARNTTGANLVSGVTSALLTRDRRATLGVLECDEAALPEIARRTHPRALLLGNLFRDQLDRYGELELTAQRWEALVRHLDGTTALLVNADDPRVGALGADRFGTVRYGIDDARLDRGALPPAADSTRCVHCGTAYDYAAVYLGHLGSYACPSCGHARPPLDVAAVDVDVERIDGSAFTVVSAQGEARVALRLPGLYNVYNALAAVAVAQTVGVETATAAARLAQFVPAFGRFEEIAVGDRSALVVLIKNPTGADEALRTISASVEGAALLLALNDQTADGHDVSWIWDVEFEAVVRDAALVVCSGSRADDLAVRMRYADMPAERLVVERDLATAFDRVVAATPPGGRALVLPTYTAMLELQTLATRRGLRAPYWEQAATR